MNYALLLSLIFFVLGILIAFRRFKMIPRQSFSLIILCFTAIAMWCAVFPLTSDTGKGLFRGLYAAFYVLESALGNVDYELFVHVFIAPPFWKFFTIILHLVLPFTAYMTIFSYFLKAINWIRYTLFRFWRSIILISQMTDKSIAYANRVVQEKGSKKLIIFCNVKEDDQKPDSKERTANMIFTEHDELYILRQLDKKNIRIMEIGNDEANNLRQSVNIMNYLKSISGRAQNGLKSVSLYTATSDPEAITILDNLMERKSEVKPQNKPAFNQVIVNEERQFVYRLLDSSLLWDAVDQDKKRLDILIVGYDSMGKELLKALSWAALFPDIETEIHVLSKDGFEDGKSTFEKYPELGCDLSSCELTADNRPIHFHTADPDSGDFESIIRTIREQTNCRVVFVSLNNDNASINAAQRVYHVFLREDPEMNPQFKILVHIRNKENQQMLSLNENRNSFDRFVFFGNDEDIYTSNGAHHASADRLAKFINDRIYLKQNPKAPSYEELTEIKKNSNKASALHIRYKLLYLERDLKKKCSGSSSELSSYEEGIERIRNMTINAPCELDVLSAWEHRRWQAYHRSEGFIGCPFERTEMIYHRILQSGKSEDEAIKETRARMINHARIHPCIGSLEHLKQISTIFGEKYNPENFENNDKKMVKSIPDILDQYYSSTSEK